MGKIARSGFSRSYVFRAGLSWAYERHAAGAANDLLALRLGELPKP
jgi:hypothetical protein